MSKYLQLRKSPPTLNVVENAREVIFTVISCMCDNEYKLTLRKLNGDGDFRLLGNGFALSNFQIEYGVDDIEWAADEGDWDKVFFMINASTVAIERLKSR